MSGPKEEEEEPNDLNLKCSLINFGLIPHEIYAIHREVYQWFQIDNFDYFGRYVKLFWQHTFE